MYTQNASGSRIAYKWGPENGVYTSFGGGFGPLETRNLSQNRSTSISTSQRLQRQARRSPLRIRLLWPGGIATGLARRVWPQARWPLGGPRSSTGNQPKSFSGIVTDNSRWQHTHTGVLKFFVPDPAKEVWQPKNWRRWPYLAFCLDHGPDNVSGYFAFERKWEANTDWFGDLSHAGN